MSKDWGMSPSEKEDILIAIRQEFNQGYMPEKDFRSRLGRLGLNASSIEEEVKEWGPE